MKATILSFAVWFSLDQTILRNSVGTGFPSICVQQHFFEFPLKPSSPQTPLPACLLLVYSLHCLWFWQGSNMTLQPPLFCRVDSATWETSGLFVGAALLRQAGCMVRLLGSHLTLPSRAVFPHKLNPVPWGCHYKMWPSGLTVCGDLSGSSSHCSEPHSRTWI